MILAEADKMEEKKRTVEEQEILNQTFRKQLTNKNEQYIYQLERSLKAANLSDEKIMTTFSTVLPLIVENQKKGVTARQLFGTVTEFVNTILAGPQKDPQAPSPDWQIALDGGLLVGGFFAIVIGLTALLNQEAAQTQTAGVLTLLVNFIAGGLAMLAFSKVAPDIKQPKGKRGYARYLLVSTVAMIGWLVVVLATQFLESTLGLLLVFPPLFYLIIGVVSLVAKWYVKKKWRIQGSIL